MDLAEAIAVLVAGVFASTMTDGLVAVAETRKSGVDAILVSIDVRAFGDGLLDDRMDGCLLDIGQHPDHHLAAALDHAEDRRLLLLQGAAILPPFVCCAGFAVPWPVPPRDYPCARRQRRPRCRRSGRRRVSSPRCRGAAPRSWLGVALAQTEFLRDLTVRQVHPHEVRAQYPGRDRLMMSARTVPVRSSKRYLHVLHK